jgi:hypothetical protein
MRTQQFVVAAALLAIPSVGYSQDRAPGPIGPNLAPEPAQPSGSPPGAGYPVSPSQPQEQPFVGYPAGPGSEAPNNLVTTPVPGGLVSAIVNGHSVIIDPTTRVIVRVLN